MLCLGAVGRCMTLYPQSIYVLRWYLMLHIHMYILKISTPPSTGEMNNHFNQILDYET